MNASAKLAPEQSKIAELIAWGATAKDCANMLNKPYNTVTNTIRRVFEKTEVTKMNELSAWWFCTHFNISVDYSPLRKKIIASCMLLFIVCQFFNPNEFNMRARRVRKTETEIVEPTE